MSTEIIFVESQLAALSDHISEGVKVRSKVQRLEQGECPTRFFFRLEKEWVEWNCVTSILDSDGIAVSSRADVEKAHVDFYSDLFSAEDIDPISQNLLFQGVTRSLSEPDRALCEGEISLGELSASLRTLNTAKAPGSDGLTVEFFSKFWNLLGPLLLEVINKCFADGEFTESMKSSVTHLIFKKMRGY